MNVEAMKEWVSDCQRVNPSAVHRIALAFQRGKAFAHGDVSRAYPPGSRDMILRASGFAAAELQVVVEMHNRDNFIKESLACLPK